MKRTNPRSMETAGEWGFILASEGGARDGMGLELYAGNPLEPGREMVAEVFRDDLVDPPTFTVTLFQPLPLRLVEALIAEARKRFADDLEGNR